MKLIDKLITTDVLVVGGGGAGLRAAIGAAEMGVSTILISKGPVARSGASPLAGADLTLDGRSLHELGFPGDPRDTKDKFFNDIVTQGFYLNDQRLVELYVEDAPKRVKELLDWGLKVSSAEERAIFTSGESITNALLKRAREVGAETMDDVMLIDILTCSGRVSGALCLDIMNGDLIVFKSKAIVLATGGWHKAYSPNAGSRELSGDGIAAAYRAGAELANMEFVTFICNAIYWPLKWQGLIFPYLLHLLVGGKLVNGRGEEFLSKYDPTIVKFGTSMEWNKSFISIANMLEVLEGKGAPHGGVYYEIGDITWEEFESRVTKRYPNWRYKGIDFSEFGKMLRDGGSIEVGPAAEYFEGGIVVNEKMETTIQGLYAAGECTSSLFGANRVAAATTEMLIEGAIAGESAAQYAKKVGMPEIDERQVEKLGEKVLSPLKRKDGIKPAELRKRIQKMAHAKLGPVRTREGIEELLRFIDVVKEKELPKLYVSSESRKYNKEWVEAIELENIIQIIELSAKSALMRTESRGVHYRLDHPYTDNDNWLKEIVVKRVNNGVNVVTRPVKATKLPLPCGVIPYWEMMKMMMKMHSDIGGHH
ncbi:MAG: FAD-binding protein [archaeon YNP-WB-062]|nr:FAD-binding protein [Candidatus Culexarchaeum yellowstonense]